MRLRGAMGDVALEVGTPRLPRGLNNVEPVNPADRAEDALLSQAMATAQKRRVRP